MLIIYERIHSLYKEKKIEIEEKLKSPPYNPEGSSNHAIYLRGAHDGTLHGFKECLELFHIGIVKEPSYNLNLKVLKLEKENKELQKIINGLQNNNNELKENNEGRAFISETPTVKFREYEIEIFGKNIRFVINASRETVLMFWGKFVLKNKFTTNDEAKSKFITFIQGYGKKGFLIYKDAKVAKKEGVRL